MRRRDEIDIEGTLVLELQHDLHQTLRLDLEAEVPRRNLMVLAKDTFKGASAKENGARSRLAGNGRLFPHMQGGASHAQGVIGAANASRTRGAIGTAKPGAQRTRRRGHRCGLSGQNNASI